MPRGRTELYKNLNKENWECLLRETQSIAALARKLECNISTIKKNLIKHKVEYEKLLLVNNRYDSLIRKKINQLTIQTIYDKNNRKYCLCLCDCNKEKEFRLDAVTSGKVISCCGRKNKQRKGQDNACYTGVQDLSGAFFGSIKSSANYRKIEFLLTKEYLWNLYIEQDKKCKFSGLDIYFPKGSVFRTGNISLDRANSTLGYIEGNVQWVHKDINMMKNVYSNEYFVKICTLVADKHK